MIRVLGALLLLVPFAALGQGSATLGCMGPTTNTDGTAITGPVSYTFRRGSNSSQFPDSSPAQSSCNYVWPNLAAGTHYFVAAVTTNLGTSAYSNVASKVIAGPTPTPTPTPPPSTTPLTITSTRINSSDWTCRDSMGTTLSSHQRQDSAFAACANLALRNPGRTYELRPSGYRIVAQ